MCVRNQVERLTPAYLKDHLREQREQKDSQVAWLILLHASWSSSCQIFDSTFADLSQHYTKDGKLRFGKLDISR